MPPGSPPIFAIGSNLRWKRRCNLQNTHQRKRESCAITPSISRKQESLSGAAWLVSEGAEVQAEFLDSLSDGEILALPYLFEFWAMAHQMPPEGDWRAWVAMGGRGAGKTRAGAEWVRAQVEGAKPLDKGRCRTVALVAETVDQARDVMVFGESGILACSPPDRRPEWQATRRRLVWPNGATAQVFSASEPESLRGPQFDCAWVDEYGCAAIDKGTNQPNKFLDPKSSESAVPHYSNGQQDELIQFQYLRAMAGYWGDPAHNPVSEEYGGPMVDMEHAYAWSWDARPYPFFPNDSERWSEGENYLRGHWITGRMTAWRLASVVEEVCGRAGLDACDTGGLHGHVRGYLVEQVAEPRAALQPLAIRYGFDAVERGGALVFRPRDGLADHVVDVDRVVRDDERDGAIEEVRGSDVELAGRVRLRFIEAGADYDVISEEAVLGVDDASVSTSEIPLAMTRAEGRQTVERWLSESRVATDTVRLTLPRSRLAVGAGDVIALPEEGGQGHFRVDRVEMLAHAQKLEAIRIEPASYRPVLVEPELGPLRGFDAPAPVTPFFLDLPLMTGEEVPQAPHVAVTARPWPGSAAVYVAEGGEDFSLDQILEARTPIGVTENALAPAPSGVFDRGAALRVRMRHGGLQSVGADRFLSGANLCAIGDGSPDGWELFQFRDAALVDVDTYEIGFRLRGQLGTEVEAIWPAGSYIVRLDGTPKQIGLTEGQIGQERHYRVGPASRPVDDPSYVHTVLAFEGAGLRPLSPVHLSVNGAPGSDMAFGWIRRTRIGGDRWETPEVPLGEEAERYVVRVVQSEAVLREEMVSAPVWTYTAAAQGADGLAGAFEVRVAQVSALVGAGRFAALGLVA